MKESITVVIVCYNRIKYTKECIFSVLKNIRKQDEILIIDNGSSDGSRELIQNITKLHNNTKLYFPKKNIYVTGAWKYVSKNVELNDYVLLLDNDMLLTTSLDNLMKHCQKLFDNVENLVSIGLFNTKIPGTYFRNTLVDENYYKKRHMIDKTEFYFTDKYSGFRIDKSNVFKKYFSNWEHKFIGEKYNQRLNANGYTTARLLPGFIKDLSENNLGDPDHRDYYKEFWGEHKNNIQFFNAIKKRDNSN